MESRERQHQLPMPEPRWKDVAISGLWYHAMEPGDQRSIQGEYLLTLLCRSHYIVLQILFSFESECNVCNGLVCLEKCYMLSKVIKLWNISNLQEAHRISLWLVIRISKRSKCSCFYLQTHIFSFVSNMNLFSFGLV